MKMTVAAVPVYSTIDAPEYVDAEDCWLEEIGPVELREYREMLMNLGFYPDKVLINTLTMIAEDYAPLERSASELYNLIRDMLLNPKVAVGRKLPLIYVIDSILKNAKGQYVPIIERTASEWIDATYKMIKHNVGERDKLRRIFYSWRDAGIFQTAPMGLMIDALADTPAEVNENSHHHFSNEITVKEKPTSILEYKEGKKRSRVESIKGTDTTSSLRRRMTFQEMRRYQAVNIHLMKLTAPSTFLPFSIPDKQTTPLNTNTSLTKNGKSISSEVGSSKQITKASMRDEVRILFRNKLLEYLAKSNALFE
jgi:hypothetical protein